MQVARSGIRIDDLRQRMKEEMLEMLMWARVNREKRHAPPRSTYWREQLKRHNRGLDLCVQCHQTETGAGVKLEKEVKSPDVKVRG